jgi:hypothetical protein
MTAILLFFELLRTIPCQNVDDLVLNKENKTFFSHFEIMKYAFKLNISVLYNNFNKAQFYAV